MPSDILSLSNTLSPRDQKAVICNIITKQTRTSKCTHKYHELTTTNRTHENAPYKFQQVNKEHVTWCRIYMGHGWRQCVQYGNPYATFTAWVREATVQTQTGGARRGELGVGIVTMFLLESSGVLEDTTLRWLVEGEKLMCGISSLLLVPYCLS